MASRQFRSFTRDSEYRDAKYIVIASEGSKTEPRYFEDLALDERYRNPRVHVEVLTRDDGSESSSAPIHVISQLSEYEQDHDLVEGDELWLVIDKDKWKESQIKEVAQLANQKGFHVADSNPAFEAWLLLHHRSLSSYSDEALQELKENRKERFRAKRRRLEQELLDLLGSYDKSNLNSTHFLPYVETAINNAHCADSDPDSRWLNHIGSRVYKLVQSIIDSSPHNPSH